MEQMKIPTGYQADLNCFMIPRWQSRQLKTFSADTGTETKFTACICTYFCKSCIGSE